MARQWWLSAVGLPQSDPVDVFMRRPAEKAKAYIYWSARHGGLTTTLTEDSVEVFVPWRPGRIYWARPAVVGRLESEENGTRLRGRIVLRSLWFLKVWWVAAVVASAVSVVVWLSNGHHLHSTSTTPGAAILLLPIVFVGGGALLTRFTGYQSSQQSSRLKRYLDDISED